MVGGGPRLSPGEVTLADHGVLFLDELPEFDRDVLEALRQPLEEGRVAIARAGRATTFPARFQLVAAMNPCPCGFAGVARTAPAACPLGAPERYERRVSGPLRDRIDLWVDDAARRRRRRSSAGREPEGSAVVAARIAAARARRRGLAAAAGSTAASRRGTARGCAGSMRRRERRVVQLAELERASGRGTERLLRVARTIADLAGDERGARPSTSTRPPGSARPTGARSTDCGRPDARRAARPDRWATSSAARRRRPTAADRPTSPPSATPGRSSPRSTVSGRSGSPRCSAGSAAAGRILEVATGPAAPCDRLAAAAGASRTGRRASAAALTLGARDGHRRGGRSRRRGSLDRIRGARAAGRHASTTRPTRAGSPRSTCRRTSCSCAATSPRSSRDHAVAVVGTRRATTPGRRSRPAIARPLVAAGATVVSGLAVGIDGAAHAAALDAGGTTVAVIGGGHARVYPRAHARLAASIVDARRRGRLGARPRRRADAVARSRAGTGSSAASPTPRSSSRRRPGAAPSSRPPGRWSRAATASSCPVRSTRPRPPAASSFLREFPDSARIVAGIPQLIEDLGLAAHRSGARATALAGATLVGARRPCARPRSAEALVAGRVDGRRARRRHRPAGRDRPRHA